MIPAESEGTSISCSALDAARRKDGRTFPLKEILKLDGNERLILNDEEPVALKRGMDHGMSFGPPRVK